MRYVLYVKIKLILSFVIFFLAILTSSCSSTQRNFEEIANSVEECPDEIVPSALKVSCYRFKNGKTSTAFALLESGTATSEPVLFLHGGPGGRAVRDRHIWLSPRSKILDTQDLILVDQKGSGESEPSLDCMETDESMDTSSISACRARLRSDGIDFSEYQINRIAAEIVDLRTFLGVEKWNLYGVSFGSRIALELLEIDNEAVNRVVLDSPLPPQVAAYDSLPEESERAVNLALDLCEKIKECVSQFSDQLNVDCPFYDNQLSRCLNYLLRKLDQNPVTYSDGDIVISVDDSVFAYEIVSALAHPDGLSVIPEALGMALSGKFAEAMKALLSTSVSGYSKGDSLSEGVQFSSECLDELPKNNPDIEKYATAIASALSEKEKVLQEICRIWTPETNGSTKPQFDSFNKHSLILTGSLDPITPSEWALKTKEILPDAILINRNDWTHAPSLSNSCAKRLVSDFLTGKRLNPEDLPC